MNQTLRRILTLSLPVALATVALACGGDDDSDPGGSAQGQATQQESGQAPGTTGPASAGDDRPEAPDDTVSDRPGGPNDSGDEPVGTKNKAGKKKDGSVSGGISPDEAPVSPESP